MGRAEAESGSVLNTGARERRAAALRFWRSPSDQPRWVRPALFALALLGALSYGWGMWREVLEPYYAGAVRSMSMSWHNFFFASLDPDGSISVDKLPGALWVQSLSVRLFGFHVWAIVLPQVLAGTLTVLVLYRVVRRLGGPVAGIVAAIVLVAASPVITGLDRDNISDTLLVLTLVLAADATVAALTSGRWRSLILAGVWVGLGFQVKMVQAWVILPALALTYLLAGPSSVKRRMLQLATAGGVCAIISLSWMTAVTLTPAHSRPYVDGSQHDSVFEQVFVYNGIGRVTGDPEFHTPALAAFADALASPLAAARKSKPGWDRLLIGSEGRNTGWLLPVAVLAGLAVLLARRRAPRSDSLRIGVVLWGTWLLLNVAVLDSGTFIQPYYAAVLSPAIAALCGLGFWEVWSGDRSKNRVRGVVIAAVVGSAGYATWLLISGSGVPWWLIALVLAVAALGTAALVAPLLRRAGSRLIGGRLSSAVLLVAALAMLVAPAAAAASLTYGGFGAFDTPFEPPSITKFTQTDQRQELVVLRASIAFFQKYRQGAKYLFAAETSLLAGPYIYLSGQEVLPIGGVTGSSPFPTVHQLQADVASGKLRWVLTPNISDPRIVWVQARCHDFVASTAPIGLYYCLPSRA